MVVSASRSASGEGELAVAEREMLEERAVKGRFRGWDWDRGLDAVGFEREVGGPDCDARAVLVGGLDFRGPLVVRSGGILID
jgi:hypothetical protein